MRRRFKEKKGKIARPDRSVDPEYRKLVGALAIDLERAH